jgi:transposase
MTDPREQRAILLAASVSKIDRRNGAWIVPSQSTPGREYRVSLDGDGVCSCPDYREGNKCKHIRAARIILKRELCMDGISYGIDVSPPERLRPRDHAAFNAAQSVEKYRFREILYELCKLVPEPEYKTGRKPHSTRDAIYAMCLKVYGTLSSRKTACDLRDAHERGFLTKVIPGMKVCHFFTNRAFTPILQRLVTISAYPLRGVETVFAVDSTGFPNSKTESWISYQQGIQRRRTVWTKAHIAIGTRTHIVAAIRIKDKNAADCAQFEALVASLYRRDFNIKEVCADKAYLSGPNVDLVFQVGGQPFIHPKSNTTGGIGGAFEKMYNYFKFRQDDFLKRYHQRSNVETVFSMIKAKFGEYVRAKSETSMVNEVLCKFVSHNVCVLNQEEQELGINPTMWCTKKKEENARPKARREAHVMPSVGC